MPPSPKTQNKRDFPGRRWLSIALRSLHLVGVVLVGAALLSGGEPRAAGLLMLLTDGKPNDLDLYDSRYGIEDTRMAVYEARRMGLTPFCVTIDREAGSYLPYLFGPAGFCVIRKPEELPRRLPLLYVQLTRQ